MTKSLDTGQSRAAPVTVAPPTGERPRESAAGRDAGGDPERVLSDVRVQPGLEVPDGEGAGDLGGTGRQRLVTSTW